MLAVARGWPIGSFAYHIALFSWHLLDIALLDT
jgi:hypothetical protein